MLNVKEIKKAIEVLPKEEFAELRKWMAETGWQEWDKEIKRDSDLGKLDFLIKEAKTEKEKGNLNAL